MSTTTPPEERVERCIAKRGDAYLVRVGGRSNRKRKSFRILADARRFRDAYEARLPGHKSAGPGGPLVSPTWQRGARATPDEGYAYIRRAAQALDAAKQHTSGRTAKRLDEALSRLHAAEDIVVDVIRGRV